MNELDLIKNSIIIIFSDHGTSVGERIGERAYGAFCYDYTIKSFVNYISSELPNQKIDQQIRHVDVMPSILEHLGIKMDQNFSKIDGISFLPLIRGEEMKEKMAYTETANPLRESKPPKIPNTSSIRTSNWKLIFNEYNGTKELYNLKEDPDEKENLIDTGLEIQEQLWNEIIKIHNKL
jgi:arylsulfatase A-like enzyme